MFLKYLSPLILILVAYTPLEAAQVKCPISRDVWISAMGVEKEFNMGAAPTIKLKVGQEFGILDFDVSKLKGKKIKSATLFVKAADKGKWGFNGGTDLRRLSLATVGKQWVEGKSNRYAKDTKGFGATHNESSYSKENWGWPGATIMEVSLGNLGTMRKETELKKDKNGYHKAPVDPALVEALISGATHGLLILDGTTDVIMNATIYAKESKFPPYLVVETAGSDANAPSSVSGFKVKGNENYASNKLGALTLSFSTSKDTFAYDVSIDGKAVDRWQIPFHERGSSKANFTIVDLEPNKEVSVSVTAIDGAGNRSQAVVAKGKTSSTITVPALPPSPYKPKSGGPKTLGSAKIWVYPEVVDVDPTTGKVQFDDSMKDFEKVNSVWDGASGSIRLAAAKGESISFQIGIKGELSNAKLSVSDLSGAGKISNTESRAFRTWYVGKNPGYNIPLKESFSVPFTDNKVSGHVFQALTVDYFIPSSTKAGTYKGKVTLSQGGKNLDFPLTVKVYNVNIPETVFFNPELNCYGGPGRAGSEQFKDSFRLAHYYRCTINRVPYSQSGRTHDDYSPKVGSNGKVLDWSVFDNNLGGLLDGSWFKDNPRAGVPVATLYLPFYEGYPLDYRKYYKAGKGVSLKTTNREEMTMLNIKSPPIDEALGSKYKNAFVNCVKDYISHFKKKGWNKTGCEFYMNNKAWKGGYAMWTLDEPYKGIDWDAINYWGLLYKEGINDDYLYSKKFLDDYFNAGGFTAMNYSKPIFLYRGDISRATMQGSMSDKIMNILYGGASQRVLRAHRERMPAILYTYGSTASEKKNNWHNVAWCYRAYSQYQDGVLPWQSLGKEGNLKTGDTSGSGNALIINGTKAGFSHAVGSVRLNALRRGAQDCELMRLLQIKKGWSRDHISALISSKVSFKSHHRVSDSADAVKFGKMTSASYVQAKESLLIMLEGK